MQAAAQRKQPLNAGLAKEASEHLWWDKMDQTTLLILTSTRQHNAKSSDLFVSTRKGNSVPWVNGTLLFKTFHLKVWTSHVYEKQYCGFSAKQKFCSQLCNWEENMTQVALLWQHLPRTVTLQRCPLQTPPQSPTALGPWAEESCKARFPSFSHTAFWAWGWVSCGKTCCMENASPMGQHHGSGDWQEHLHISANMP